MACRAAVLAGAEIEVPGGTVQADRIAAIYARRERHVRRAGIATVGFAAAVEVLTNLGSEPIRMGAVKVGDSSYHFQLFFDEAAAAVIACLGVQQR